MTSALRIDVVICTYNRAAELDEVLQALARQIGAPTLAWTALVVDNASTDDTSGVVARHRAAGKLPALDYVYEGEPGLTAARRRGMLETTAPWVAFVDDDNLLEPQWLAAIADAIRAHPEAGGVGGAIALAWGAPPPFYLTGFGFCYAEQQGGASDHIVDNLAGAGMVLRREAVAKSGWLERPLVADRIGRTLVSGGDVELAQRVRAAGYELWVTPDAVMRHGIPASRMTRRYLLRMNYELGASSALIGLLIWAGDWLAWQRSARVEQRQRSQTARRMLAHALRYRSGVTGAIAWVSFARGFAAGVRRCQSLPPTRRAELLGAARLPVRAADATAGADSAR